MRRHVVGAFEVVDERRIAVGDQSCGKQLQIAPNGRIGVLADNQRRTRVQQEDVAEPAADPRPSDGLLDLAVVPIESLPSLVSPGRVEQHVVGHDQVRVGGDAQVGDVDAAAV